MLIKRIEIKNFRRLIGPVFIDNLKSGINVIAGDNEEGKSTLLQALKALFFQRHNSTSQAVNDFQPYNYVVRPEVAVDFEWESNNYSVRKGFCVKPYLAEFRSSTGHTTGAEAEEKITELFRLPGGEKGRSAANPDHGLWGLLWMEQGTASNGLNLSSGGKESLTKALESDLGALTGGQSGRTILKNIAAKCAEVYTATGKEKGILKDARANLAAISSDFAECEQKFLQYEKKTLNLSKIQESLAKHLREKTLENAKIKLEELDKDIRRINELKLEDRTAKESERAAALEFKTQKEKLDSRLSLTSRKELLITALAQKEKEIASASALNEECNATTKSCLQEHELAEAALKAAEQSVINAESRDQLIALQKSQVALQQTIASLAEVQTQIDRYTAEAQAILIDQNVYVELRTLDSAATEAEIEARVASARVVVKPLPNKKAFINEKEIIADEQNSIAEPTKITLTDWGEIEIYPGGEDTAQLVKSAKFKRQKFSAALRKTGITTLQEGADLLDKRKQLMSEIEQAKLRAKMLCDGGSAQTLIKDLQKVELQIQQHGTPQLPEAGGDVSLAEIRKAREQLRTVEVQKKQLLESAKSQTLKANNSVTTKIAEKGNLTNSLSEVDSQLLSLSNVAQEVQQKAVGDAERIYLEAQNRSKLIGMKIAESDSTTIEKTFESSRAAFAKVDFELKELQIQQSGLAGEITAEGNAGLGETLERLRGEKELAENDLNRIDKKARALKLLLETLVESEREAKEHFLEPVFEKLKPHLQIVFPGANIIMDKQDVEIAHLQRNGVEEVYMSLSTGTREQLSVLTRLAIARLLKERNQPSFVVLDDALVYSDARRFAQMKEVLQEVAKDVQILILTCRKSDYEDMTTANFIDFRSQPSLLGSK